jgi:hypothetical protein
MDMIDRIETVRKDNNRLWMDILRLALEAEPQRAKAILLKIKRNDGAIQRMLGELASS